MIHFKVGTAWAEKQEEPGEDVMSQVKVLMVRLVDLIILSVEFLVVFTILENCQLTMS